MSAETRMENRRAIEALRAGVPNRDAVRVMGSSQPELEKIFLDRLKDARDGFRHNRPGSGMLVTGDFGSGKSHLLEYFKHIALEENFVCSKIVVSKETPLYSPDKIFRSAIESAVLPDRRGSALTEITSRLDFTGDAYTGFFQWVHSPESGVNLQFAATLYLYVCARGNDELRDRIVRFWSGDPLNISELRKYLKEVGEAASYKIDKISTKELARQRYLFVPRLIIAAGYSGWVLLIDEAELVGRYSLKQRANSYAEIARLAGKLEGAALPGLISVITLSDDFESIVMDYRQDEEKIPAKYRESGSNDDSLVAAQAERGMRLIRQEKRKLERLNLNKVRATYEKLRTVYQSAYNWEPPQDRIELSIATSDVMRQYIRRWITEWDLNRIHPGYRPQIEVSALKQEYLETLDLDRINEEDRNTGPG
jgi:hypothetical protein